MGLGKFNINVPVNNHGSRYSNRSGDTSGSLKKNASFLSENKLNAVRMQESMESRSGQEQVSNSPRTRFVDQSNDGDTLLTIDEVVVITNSAFGVSMYLPDVSLMQGKEMKFINAYNSYENYFNILGPFFDDSTNYSLTMFGQTVTLISDGSHWFII